MKCVSCLYDNRVERAVRGKPACARCVALGALRGYGAAGLPWYVRVFGRSVVTPSGCWEYTASRDTSGYGSPLMVGDRLVRPHRLVLEDTQPQPAGYEADHECHNRACVRPDHLRWLTHRDNCRNRRRGLLTADQKRIKHNAYQRAYSAAHRDRINAARKARNWGR